MDKHHKNGSLLPKGFQHKVLSKEETEMVFSFCKIFMDEQQHIDLEKMTQDLQTTEEFNVEVVKRILTWMQNNTKTHSKLIRNPLR